MKISVIIATLNRPQDIERVLNSLLGQTYLPTETIVVDQSDDDKTRLALEALQPVFSSKGVVLRYFFQSEKSAVKSRNTGIVQATGDILSFLDDDSELHKDYYEKVVAYFEKNPSLGAVGGSLVREDMVRNLKGVLRRLLWRLFLINFRDGRVTPSGFGYPIYERPVTGVTKVDMLHGCNMNYRTSVVRDLRFDEWFVGYSFREDADFSYQISKKAPVWMVPDALSYHHESAGGRLDIERLKRMEIRNYHYFFRKHADTGVFSRLLFFYSLSGILLIDLLEFAFSFDKKKFKKFRAGVSEAFLLSRQTA